MKKLGLTALAIVMALGMIGVGYAWWEQNLTINTTVDTGNLALIFKGTVPVEFHDTTGWVDCTFTPNGETATLTITNAFQNAVIPVKFIIKNTGTIPADEDDYYGMDPAGDDEFFALANQITPGLLNPGAEGNGGFDLIVAGDVVEDAATPYSITIKLHCFQGVGGP